MFSRSLLHSRFFAIYHGIHTQHFGVKFYSHTTAADANWFLQAAFDYLHEGILQRFAITPTALL